MRKTFTMATAQRDKLLEAMQPVPAMWIGGPPRSVQQNANDAWIALGESHEITLDCAARIAKWMFDTHGDVAQVDAAIKGKTE